MITFYIVNHVFTSTEFRYTLCCIQYLKVEQLRAFGYVGEQFYLDCFNTKLIFLPCETSHLVRLGIVKNIRSFRSYDLHSLAQSIQSVCVLASTYLLPRLRILREMGGLIWANMTWRDLTGTEGWFLHLKPKWFRPKLKCSWRKFDWDLKCGKKASRILATTTSFDDWLSDFERREKKS